MSAIIAIGTATPPYKQTQLQAVENVAVILNLEATQRRLLKSIYKSTGITERYSVLKDACLTPGQFEFFPNDPNANFPSTSARMKIYKDQALPLAKLAVIDALKNKAINKKQITHIITVSCTGMYAPGIDIELIQSLNLNKSIGRTAINFMGCYGTFNAIKVADAICRADKNACVLIVSVELCTLHFKKSDSLDDIIANAIFADGAGALLIQSTSNNPHFKIDAFHCDLLPNSSQAMAWHISDSGFDIVLSSYVPEAIESGIKTFVKRLMDKQSLLLSDIDLFAIHPGGKKILQAAEKALNISCEDNRYSYQVLNQFGNMSSATIIFVLKKIWQDILEHEQKRIFSCAFGPGLTLESMLLKVVTA